MVRISRDFALSASKLGEIVSEAASLGVGGSNLVKTATRYTQILYPWQYLSLQSIVSTINDPRIKAPVVMVALCSAHHFAETGTEMLGLVTCLRRVLNTLILL